MKFNWSYFFQFLALVTVAQIIMQTLGITGVLYYVICFCIGFFSDNLFSWLYGRKVRLFEIDVDKGDKQE